MPISIDNQPQVRTGNSSASLRYVTPGLFAALGIPLRPGRDVSDTDTGDRQFSAVVSESFVRRFWPGGKPLGRHFQVAFHDRTVVGVNKFIDETEDHKVEVHPIDPTTEPRKIERLKEIKRTRDNDAVERALAALVEVAKDPDANLMPATIDAVRTQASMGEIVYRLEALFGRYTETPVF